MATRGTVYLVGAGPGDPELLTLKGKRLLEAADVVVYDRLIDPRILALARCDAEMVDVGKVPGDQRTRQDDISELLVDRAAEARSIVRLKGGDPFVFGRGGEEGLALRRAGVPFEVIPAATSAVAAPAYAGIPVTHRGIASSVTFVAGNWDPARDSSSIDWDAVAGTGGTIVVMMGRDNLHWITGRLLEAGMSRDTPAALVRWGSVPAQRTLTGTLYDIAARADDAGLPPPVVLVVGGVVGLRPHLKWFEEMPLFGKRVLVTRTRTQASALSACLTALGAMPLEVPTVEIEPIDSPTVREAVRHLPGYDWVAFTSANAVGVLFKRLADAGRDARALAGVSVAAIGPATAAALKRHGVRADTVPENYIGEKLAEAIGANPVAGKRVLLPRSAGGRTEIVSALTALGAVVDDVPTYRVVMPGGSGKLLERHLAGGIDVATFTSSSTVTNLLSMISDTGELGRATIACIGPITAKTAREGGLKVDIVASEHTVDGLVDALSSHFGHTT